jgi:hypothetical protein
VIYLYSKPMSINKRLIDKTTDKHNYIYGITITCPATCFGPRGSLSGYKDLLSGYCYIINIIVFDGSFNS